LFHRFVFPSFFFVQFIFFPIRSATKQKHKKKQHGQQQKNQTNNSPPKQRLTATSPPHGLFQRVGQRFLAWIAWGKAMATWLSLQNKLGTPAVPTRRAVLGKQGTAWVSPTSMVVRTRCAA
tara:strand:- start:11 stop:373 length:363 start_codon:yes stop_codon:yes gene_type:complete